MISGQIQNRRRIWVKAIHIAMADVLFGFNLGVFNPCLDNIAYSLSWGDSEKTLHFTMFSSLIAAGALVGSSLTSKVAGSIGRNRTLLLNDMIMIIGSGLSIATITPIFGIGRFIVGISTGVSLAIAPMYISKTTPQEMMRSVGPMMSILIAVGLTTSYGFGLVLPIQDFESPLTTSGSL